MNNSCDQSGCHFDLHLRPNQVPILNGFVKWLIMLKKKVRALYLILGVREHNNNLFLFDYVAKTPNIANWPRSLPDEPPTVWIESINF